MKKRPTPASGNQTPCDKAILPQQELFGNELAAPYFDDESDSRPFLGTDNPRHLRAVHALLSQSALPRQQLDSVAGCSNGPEMIAELRRRGLDVPCDRIPALDRDGRPCRPGMYRLTQSDRRKLRHWLTERGRS